MESWWLFPLDPNHLPQDSILDQTNVCRRNYRLIYKLQNHKNFYFQKFRFT